MKKTVLRVMRVMLGLLLYALSIVLSINSNLGMAPWELFHSGIAQSSGFSMGQVTIFFSFVIVAIDFLLLQQKIGLGTLMNMVGVGTMVDVINNMGIIPVQSGIMSPYSYIQHFLCMVCVSFAIYFYIGAGYGAGPRDGLFIGISKKFNISTKMAKSVTEVFAFAIGALLGAHFGIGTAIFAFLSGPILQQINKQIKFDLNSVKHEYIDDMVLAARKQ